MTHYMVDGKTLTTEEEARHKSACNAALSAIAKEARAELDENADHVRDCVAIEAFDYADAVVREHRRRILVAYAPPEPPPATAYRMIDDQALITRWVEGDFELSVPRNLAIAKAKKLTYPLTLKEITEQAEIRHDIARELCVVEIFVPAEKEVPGAK